MDMGLKQKLSTVRFSPEEGALVEEYLGKNPLFESFSALARVAMLTFIGHAGTVHLNAITTETKAKQPRFMWDYDLSDVQIKEIINSKGLSQKKRWLIGRILCQARFDEVFDYLTLPEIKNALPLLRLPKKIRERWKYAIERWSRHE